MRKLKYKKILDLVRESATSVLPISLIILVLCFTIIPIPVDTIMAFIIGALLLIIGMGLFNIGVENSLTPIGNATGTWLTKTKKLGIILLLSFALGTAVTIAEPDLQVLATNASGIDSTALILTVAIGSGFFLLIAMLRILLNIKLKWLLFASYGIVLILTAFSDPSFIGIAYDSGGVTTGPMTVPFIMALGVGVSALRSDKNAAADSFGLVSLCSIGPIIAVLILGFIYNVNADTAAEIIPHYSDTLNISKSYLEAIPGQMRDVAISLSSIFIFFILFQLAVLRMNIKSFLRILVGIIYTYVGLVLFLTGVTVGFSPLGKVLGEALVNENLSILLLPIAAVMGWFTISAEPAVHVLNRQVEGVSAGVISGKTMGLSLSVSVAAAMTFSMIRIITGISVLWFLVPGYLISLLLMFFVPDIFVSIAFDSGGIAAGTLTGAFMLPFAIGVSTALGGDVLKDSFGLIALVAMMPLITIQLMGIIYKIKLAKAQRETKVYGDIETIDLWKA